MAYKAKETIRNNKLRIAEEALSIVKLKPHREC